MNRTPTGPQHRLIILAIDNNPHNDTARTLAYLNKIRRPVADRCVERGWLNEDGTPTAAGYQAAGREAPAPAVAASAPAAEAREINFPRAECNNQEPHPRHRIAGTWRDECPGVPAPSAEAVPAEMTAEQRDQHSSDYWENATRGLPRAAAFPQGSPPAATKAAGLAVERGVCKHCRRPIGRVVRSWPTKWVHDEGGLGCEGQKTEAKPLVVDGQVAEAAPVPQADAGAADGVKFPPGTPEYEAYVAELTAELDKFSRGEHPYEGDRLR